jgi:peptidyl-tRNA hydrolase
MNDELKLYCVVSSEAVALCKGVRGKMASQAGHAYLHTWWDALERFPERAKAYKESQAAVKITLVASEAEINELWERYGKDFPVSRVVDAARTVFEKPTVTALGIGPIRASERDELLASLRPWT